MLRALVEDLRVAIGNRGRFDPGDLAQLFFRRPRRNGSSRQRAEQKGNCRNGDEWSEKESENGRTRPPAGLLLASSNLSQLPASPKC